MAKTIIQTIGPLYGEAVNGTVFGRPNGSIYVPSSNLISITLGSAYRYVYEDSTTARICDSAGTPRYGAAYNINWVAEVQDLSGNVQLQIYSDSDCTQLVASRDQSAGSFNNWGRDLTLATGQSITDGTTYYLRAQVMNNGVPVATSNVIEIVGVAE